MRVHVRGRDLANRGICALARALLTSKRMRVLTASVLFALLTMSPRADACINAVAMTQNEATYRIAAVHAAMRLEQYWFANLMIPEGNFGKIGVIQIIERLRDGEEDGFDLTLLDAQQVIDMRWGDPDDDDAEELASYFQHRLGHDKAPRFIAWRAEALAIQGETELAVAALRELEQRDLMPDAHAYVTLAALTTGAEQLRATAKCRVRALVKSVCPTTSSIEI